MSESRMIKKMRVIVYEELKEMLDHFPDTFLDNEDYALDYTEEIVKRLKDKIIGE